MSKYVIAGGTSGIGRECVLRLLDHDHEVIAIGRSETHVAELRASSHAPRERLQIVVGDLADPMTARRVADAAAGTAIEGLVNSAGIVSVGGIEDEDLDGWRRTMASNLDGIFILTKAMLPLLRRATGAAIVNVSSTCSQKPCDSLAYSVSKAGVDMLTKHLARDLSGYGIRVNSVNPGVVKTNLQMSSGVFPDERGYNEWIDEMAHKHPLGVGAAEDVCDAILFLLGPHASWITGATLTVDGGRAVAC